jgi:JAB1/Mov34/MPN/PAD-1 ubiquitin protease
MAPPEVESSSSDAPNKKSAVNLTKPAIDEVIIHPLVLLSAADHYHRVARGTRKRVVGVLLGSIYRGKVDATNSFALPFEEDSRNPVSSAYLYSFVLCCALSQRSFYYDGSFSPPSIVLTSSPSSTWTITSWRTCWSCSKR